MLGLLTYLKNLNPDILSLYPAYRFISFNNKDILDKIAIYLFITIKELTLFLFSFF
jgi:hypothetical protein